MKWFLSIVLGGAMLVGSSAPSEAQCFGGGLFRGRVASIRIFRGGLFSRMRARRSARRSARLSEVSVVYETDGYAEPACGSAQVMRRVQYAEPACGSAQVVQREASCGTSQLSTSYTERSVGDDPLPPAPMPGPAVAPPVPSFSPIVAAARPVFLVL
jgi:hypothetical protein